MGRGSWSVAVRVQVRYAMPATETNRLEEEEERRGKTMTRSDRIVELITPLQVHTIAPQSKSYHTTSSQPGSNNADDVGFGAAQLDRLV